MKGATTSGAPPQMAEWLLPLAARALADQVQAARDTGGETAPPLVRVDDLVDRFPNVLRDLGKPTGQWALQIDALEALYAAEVARARQDRKNPALWERTVDACSEASLAWEEAYACWRAAEALLTRGHGGRERAAGQLRRGLALTEELQARPLHDALHDLALSARIPVDPVGPAPRTGAPGSAIGQAYATLTSREREIANYLVAGRTYREIAQALVISEKTVSSHISNLLRKTGAANRIDLARMLRPERQP